MREAAWGAKDNTADSASRSKQKAAAALAPSGHTVQ
jgi:hypothetical protein